MSENEGERWLFVPADGGEPQELQPGPNVTGPGYVVPTSVIWQWVEGWAGESSEVDDKRIMALYMLLLEHARPDTEKPAFLGPAGDGGAAGLIGLG